MVVAHRRYCAGRHGATFRRCSAACAELSWLLSRGYPETASLKLVGDRHGLATRQRQAVSRSACPDVALEARRRGLVPRTALAGQRLAIDGLNALITLETALSGGLIVVGRDGRSRDLAGVHGAFRPGDQTGAALELLGVALVRHGCSGATWYLDRPVSHSGELAAQLVALAAARGWAFEARVVNNPDRELVASGQVVVSSDAWVLERTSWTDLLDSLLEERSPGARTVDLRGG